MKRYISRWLNWELWPFTLIYAPLGFVWMYYVVKAKAFWFFSNANPTLTFGGFEGERKKEMYAQLPPDLYPPTVFVSANEEMMYVSYRLTESGIRFPFIVKPDVGTQGLMFRKINNLNELIHYHSYIGADYVVQSFVDLPEEYSVFYIRYPGETKGKITGLVLKEYLSVTGNGTSSLSELIANNGKAKYRRDEMFQKHKLHLADIIPAGEKYYLSIAGNHNRGARFINLHQEIDEQLSNTFNKISHAVPYFHYGRYDLKCTSLADLKNGTNIQMLEYNGAGAEPNHIYDCGMNYFTALKIIQQHWKDLYCIGRINYKKGVPYWSFRQGRKHMRKTNRFYKKLRSDDLKLDMSMAFFFALLLQLL